MSYIMITPVKNEIEFIADVIKSIANQTELPTLWVIIDGGSTDGTIEAIRGFSKRYEWITVREQTKVEQNANKTHKNVSLAVNEAYLFAKQYCYQQHIPYDYIWTIDGDQVLSSNVCHDITDNMDKDITIGAASGIVYNPDGTQDAYPNGELPNKRVYRRTAIEDIGGFPVTKYSYDTVILAKLRISGSKIKTFADYKICNLREDSGIERNAWESYVQFGKARYYLGYSLPLLILGCGYLSLQFKFLKAMGILYGYIMSDVYNEETISDKDVWGHFHYNRLREVLWNRS